MAVNYMDRLAALRGDHQHAAGAHGSTRSAPVLHADEKRHRKRKRKLSRKQKAALAKGRRVMAQMRRAKKRRRHGAEEKKMPKKRKRPHPSGIRGKRGRTSGRKAVARRKAQLHRLRVLKRGGSIEVHGKKAIARYKRLHGIGKKKRRRSKKAKHHHKKRKHGMGKSKASRAARKAARTRARNKAARSAAARKAARSRKRHGGGRKRHGRKRHHKRSYHKKRKHHRPRGRARRRVKGLVRRNNRTGKFVGRGGRSRRSHIVHYGRSRKRGGYHKAGRIAREGHYSMENPLDGGELATGLGMGLIGFLVADTADRMWAGRGPLGGTAAALAAPLYSDYYRLGTGILLTVVPLASAHFIDGAKHRHLRAGIQFFGFGAGVRTLGHLIIDAVTSMLKNNATVGPTLQSLYPNEIVAQGQIAGAAKVGAGALPEQIGAAAFGMGAIPEGLAACCNNSSRMLNPSLSVLQPIGRSAEMGGAAAGFAPPPVALPPPIERIVQQPYAPPQDYRRGGGGGNGGTRQTAVPTGQPQLPTGQPATPATTVVAAAPAATSMVAAYAPVAPAGGPPGSGVNGLPQSPFAWGTNDSPD